MRPAAALAVCRGDSRVRGHCQVPVASIDAHCTGPAPPVPAHRRYARRVVGYEPRPGASRSGRAPGLTGRYAAALWAVLRETTLVRARAVFATWSSCSGSDSVHRSVKGKSVKVQSRVNWTSQRRQRPVGIGFISLQLPALISPKDLTRGKDCAIMLTRRTRCIFSLYK